MPIVVAHESDPRGIAGVAFNAGLGQYRLKQQEMGLQWTQLALQNQAQQNQAALGYQRNMLDYQQQQDANARWASDRQQQAMFDMAQMNQRQQQFDAGLSEQQRWRDAQMEQHQGDLAFRRESQQAGFANQQSLMEQEFAGRAAYAKEQRQAEYDDFMKRADDELSLSGKRFRAGVQNKLDAVDEAITNGEMHWEDGEIAKKEIHARAAGVDVSGFLTPSDLARKKQKLREQIEASTIEIDGRTFVVNKDGVPSEMAWKRDPQAEAKTKRSADLHKRWVAEAEVARNNGQTMPSYDEWLAKGWRIHGLTPEERDEMFPDGMPTPQQTKPVSPEVELAAKSMDPTTATKFKMLHSEDYSKAPPEIRAASEYLKEVFSKYPTPQAQMSFPPQEVARAERAAAMLESYRRSNAMMKARGFTGPRPALAPPMPAQPAMSFADSLMQ